MIKFVFFDLGNVLVLFSEQQLAMQVAEVAECSVQHVFQTVFEKEHHRQYECGAISEDEYYELLCHDLGCRPDQTRLENAMCDIFVLNHEILPLLEILGQKNIPRGILSNVGPSHWRHCRKNFPELFDAIPSNRLASFEVGAAKPDRKIFEAAHNQAALVVPNIQRCEVLFIDDMLPNISAAKEFGWDAVQYVGTEQLRSELKNRGVI